MSPAPVSSGFETPAGLSKHTWVDRPDTKYNLDGLYKSKLVCDLAIPAVAAFKERIDTAAQAALEAEVAERYRKGWSRYLPYSFEEDDTGAPTGRIVFEFKRNARVTIRSTGEVKELSVAVYDSKNRQVLPTPPVLGGSLIRIAGHFRPIKLSTTNRVGVRMDFFAVKVLKMNEGPPPFSEDDIEGGWEGLAYRN